MRLVSGGADSLAPAKIESFRGGLQRAEALARRQEGLVRLPFGVEDEKAALTLAGRRRR